MESISHDPSTTSLAVTGEVIYELLHRPINRKSLKQVIHRELERRLSEASSSDLIWASYLVIFSPGQAIEEIRCQLDVETNGERAAFAVGYGTQPHLAFSDALERLQWYGKNLSLRNVI